jgi:RNA 3'-terminal phosphate cyclase-like protein
MLCCLLGITNDPKDPSVDTFRSTTIPLLKRFGVPSEGLDLKIESRGSAPHGGGEVVLSVPIVQSLNVSFCLSTSSSSTPRVWPKW